MTGDEMRAIREGLGLSQVQFGNALGYGSGNRNTVSITVDRYERGKRLIPKWVATTVRALDRDGLLVFINSYRGADDQVEFVRQLSLYLAEGAPAQ